MGDNRVITHKAENRDPNPGPAGEKPYEMAGRAEDRKPLFDFQDVSGWEVVGMNAEGWLRRSQERRLFGDYCGKLTYLARGESPCLVVRPKTPLPIPDPWDAVNFWSWGNNWGSWVLPTSSTPPARPDDSIPPVSVSAVIRDATGKEFELPLGTINYQYWFLMNGRLKEPVKSEIKRPAELVGFRVTGGTNQEERTIYLGPVYFFKENLEPLTFSPWPDRLPFPTRPETVLPTNKTGEFKNETRQEGDAVVFTYRGTDCSLDYWYRPMDATLGDIELRYQGRSIRPCAGGGVRIQVPGGTIAAGDPSFMPILVEQRLHDDVLTVRWRLEAGALSTELEYRLHIAQKSLVVEMEAADPVIDEISLGRAEPVKEAKLIWVPYLSFGHESLDPRVLYADGLFHFTQLDWYYSDASELFAKHEVGDGWAMLNGGARYLPKTDGGRNRLRERLFINASPDFQEVLPTIPNPKSPYREVQGERLWRVRWYISYPDAFEDVKQLRDYGCDKVTIRYHEDCWRDAGESFTFRLNAAPKRGGDAALRDFVSSVKSLGWRIGLYTCYTDFTPVNSYWDENWVNRMQDGEWQRGWYRCYIVKPTRAVEAEALLAPQIHAKFGTNHSYCDVITSYTPFHFTDFDARVPGAGTFRRTFECYGLLLYNERSAHRGPVFSEGTHHWWYAGLVDGNYAQISSGEWTGATKDAPSVKPLLVDFDLLKMHPLQMDAGMSYPERYFRGNKYDLDHFIAATIAYGHIGFLDWADLAGTLKIYYMIQQLQSRYAMVPVDRIEYEDNGELVDSSRALVSDAYLRNRVHVTYENGTEVFVNGNGQPWTVLAEGRSFELPSWGYLAYRTADHLLVYSATVPVAGAEATRGPRQRVDLSLGTRQFYADSRGGYALLGSLGVEGSGALKREMDTWWLIAAPEFRDFAFDPKLMDLGETRRDLDAIPVSEGGSAGNPKLRWSRGMLHVVPTAGVSKYELHESDRPRPAMIECADMVAVAGSTVHLIALPTEAVAGSAFWEVDGVRTRAKAIRDGKGLNVSVPAGIVEGQHIWLGIPAGAHTLWLDFVGANQA